MAARGNRERLWAGLGWGLAVTAVIVLAGLWWYDRVRVREEPRWDPALFTVLRQAPPADGSEARDTWAVIVNPQCPHCARSLLGAQATIVNLEPRPRLAVLVVDTPLRPAPGFDSTLGVPEVWWDAEGVWRRRWGMRVYGEVLRFDAAGGYRGTLPPFPAGGLAPQALPAATTGPPAPRP